MILCFLVAGSQRAFHVGALRGGVETKMVAKVLSVLKLC
jgi:hypothetical protein